MLSQAIKSAVAPVRAVIDGSPVLARRLRGVGADTREKSVRLKELELQKLRGEWKKLPEEQRLAAELAHRKTGRGKRVDAVMSGAVLGIFALITFGSYLRWVLVAVLIVWSIAAMAHAPKQDAPAAIEDADEALPDGEGDDDQDAAPAAAPRPLTAAELVTTIEHMVAVRAQHDGGAGNVLISEALAVLQRHRQFERYDAREFGAAVRAAGVPPKKSVAVGSGASRRTSPGWSVAHLTELLGRAPVLPPHAVPDRTPVNAA